MSDFDWSRAQDYEAKWGKAWLLGEQPSCQKPSLVNEFFGIDVAALMAHVSTRTVIEVGCGPNPMIHTWSAHRRILVDPLLARYGLDFGGCEMLSERAEDALPRFASAIDGAVVCRNCIDHSDSPIEILDLALACAAPGAYLLFFSDLEHLRGCDEGHRNVGLTPDEVAARIQAAGFSILGPADMRPVHDPNLVSYGCYAVRQ